MRRRLLATLTLSLVACSEDATFPLPSTMQLVFAVQPSATDGNVTLTPAPQVVIQDELGNTDRGATTAVTLSLAPNANGAKLRGTVTVNAVGGVATFADVRIDRPGGGLFLIAEATALPAGASRRFDVRLTFTQVTVGIFHSCGLTTAGFAFCWGANDVGQLGLGTTGAPQPSPRRVSFACP